MENCNHKYPDGNYAIDYCSTYEMKSSDMYCKICREEGSRKELENSTTKQKYNKVWLSKVREVAEIIDVKDEWTSFPHGSGTDYKIYTIKKKDGSTFKFNDPMDRDYAVLLPSDIENENSRLKNKILDYTQEIKENEAILKELI